MTITSNLLGVKQLQEEFDETRKLNVALQQKVME
jgi:hypothetical protein